MDEIEIELRLFHSLSKLLPKEEGNLSHRFTLPQGTTIEEVLKMISVPQDLPIIILLNGISVGQNTKLSSDDVLSLMLPAGGG